MSGYSGESSRFMGENWIVYGNNVLRVNGLKGETVAQVYLIADEKPKRESIVRLIAAAPEMHDLLMECADELEAVGLPTLSRECYELIAHIDGKEASHE